MSTFVMDTKGYDKLASELYSMATSNIWYNEGRKHAVRKFLGLKFGDESEQVKAAIQLRINNLISANNHAWDARYNDKSEADYWEYKTQLSGWTPIQVIKNLECLSYQLAEGDVYKSDIYNLLDELIDGLARAYVHGSPDYEKASWGW